MKNIKFLFLIIFNFHLYASYNSTDNSTDKNLDKKPYDNLISTQFYKALSKKGWLVDEYDILEATYLNNGQLRLIKNLEKIDTEYKIKMKPIIFGIVFFSLLSSKTYFYYKKIKNKDKKGKVLN